jgi:hypothetical protein
MLQMYQVIVSVDALWTSCSQGLVCWGDMVRLSLLQQEVPFGRRLHVRASGRVVWWDPSYPSWSHDEFAIGQQEVFVPLRIVVYAEAMWLNDLGSSELLEEHPFLLVQRAWHEGEKQ